MFVKMFEKIANELAIVNAASRSIGDEEEEKDHKEIQLIRYLAR